MREFIAETETEPRLRASLYPAEDGLGGWRIVIETVDPAVAYEPLRSAWEPTLQEAVAHTDLHWPTKPIWKDVASGEIVEPSSEDAAA
jgi:hypothetical protein